MKDLEFSKTLKDLNLEMFKVVRKRHKESGVDLTPIQATIILALFDAKEVLCQKDLESFVSCNKSTLSSILDTMEKKDLIERKIDKVDTRKKEIVLTQKSLDLTNEIVKDKRILDQQMVKGITKEEIESLQSTLNKMLRNLERM